MQAQSAPRPGDPARPPVSPASATLNEPPVAATAALRPVSLIAGDFEPILWILAALGLSAFLSTLRSALRFSLPSRTVAREPNEARRRRLEHLLEQADAHGTSAGIFKITCDLVFTVLLVGYIAGQATLTLEVLALAVAIAAPTLLLCTEAMPVSVARAWGDRLLVQALPAFHWAQLPLVPVVKALQMVRRALLRALSIEDDTSSRRIVEGLRDVVRTSGGTVELAETERELIENVMEFGNVDAAEVMTPRTEIIAVPVEATLEEVLKKIVEAGNSRLPVYDDGIDNIIGTVSAIDVAEALVDNRGLPERGLRELLRPPMLVPETKLVRDLLREFRSRKQKLAIVVDEYGGTAGVVSLTDVLGEIVGYIRDEHEEGDEGLRPLGDGTYEVQAGLHVSEVNEALGLSIPEEEDFETLGGFVLAQLGHFPKPGESFQNDRVTYSIAEASDRRVLKVRVQRSAG